MYRKSIFEIPKKKLGGSCSVTDFWSNLTSIRYLKENKMFCNKELILKEFKELGKQLDLKRKQSKIRKEQEEIKRYRSLLQNNKSCSEKNLGNMQPVNPKEACCLIKRELKDLGGGTNKYRTRSSSRRVVKELEVDIESIDGLGKRFNSAMMLLL